MTNDQLMVEVGNLRAENRYLRRRLPGSTGDMRHLRRAYQDAKAMLVRRFSGYSISRQECELAGIPRRRWPWAVALLKTAGVYACGDVAIHDFTDALAMLEAEYGGMERAGTIKRLRAAMPPSIR